MKLLETYLKDQKDPDCKAAIADLREQIQQIPTDSFTIRKHIPEIEEAWTDAFWNYLSSEQDRIPEIESCPAPATRPWRGCAAATFISKVERLKLLKRTGKDTTQAMQSIAEDAAVLPDFVVNDPKLKPHVQKCIPEELTNASLSDLSNLRDALAPQMKYSEAGHLP